jgi:hypothetical protein
MYVATSTSGFERDIDCQVYLYAWCGVTKQAGGASTAEMEVHSNRCEQHPDPLRRAKLVVFTATAVETMVTRRLGPGR